MKQEDLKIGEKMLYDGVMEGINKISKNNPEIADPMSKFWNGELSWDEQIDIITDGFSKRLREEINSSTYKKLHRKREFKNYIDKIVR